ncbi:hypothetical protein C8Q72DRAFT_773651 [Fomitopsis betulina]|nr:hypothetical protein C8Q72DRAFT_773651 [Fomitopsis betulina]
MRHRPASNLLSDTTLSSTPLRIRIPSFRKSSPARVAISPFPSEPTSPVESSSPPSPNLPTSTAETSLDSELSDLTPIEDSTDEGESEIEEPESADDTASLGERRSRLRSSQKEEKGPSMCSTRRCQNLLGPGNTWKHCDICREYNRRLQQKARHEQEGEYKWKMCKPCRQTQQKDKYAAIFESPALPRGKKRTRGDVDLDSLELQNAYQCLDELIQEMGMRYRNFFTTQLHYLQYKATRGLDISTAMPIHFGFDGEYSVVADPAGGMVDFVVKLVARQIQAVLGLQFQPAGVAMGPEATVISRFQCKHEEHIPLLPDPANSDASRQILISRMQGLLNIAVAWDRRHKYFPGQQIHIQFQLHN